MKKKVFSVKSIATTAIMSAISVILYMFVKFPLPSLFPAFLDIQISELPCIIVGYMFGPILGCISVLIRCLIKLPFTTTAGVGELGDLIIGLILILVSSLIYKRKKTFKRALLSYILGSICATMIACLVNAYILVPFYMNVMNFNIDMLVGACSMIPNINVSNFMIKYLVYAIIPFNLLRYLIVGIFTFLLYKKIHNLIEKIK